MVSSLLFLIGIAFLFVNPYILAISTMDFPQPRFFLNILTHMLSHANADHLIGNYTFMAPAMLYLERLWGCRRFLISYFVCGLYGLVFYWGMSEIPGIYLIGSSGAGFGLCAAAALIYFFRQKAYILPLILMLVVLENQVGLAISDTFGLGGVAYWAHIGGALCGFILAVLYHFKNLGPQNQSPQKP